MQKFELTPSNPIAQRATVIDDPAQVEARLQELHPDLTLSLFRDVITGGLSSRNEVTEASAPTAAGVLQWLRTVHDLRTVLATFQWNIHQQQNCPFISSPNRAVSIVVMTGNSETGKKGFEDPTNQAEKGTVAEEFIKQNHQLELFNRESFKFAKGGQKENQAVWALLYHYDKKLKEVRFELSLPTGFGKRKITEWGERLILGSIPDSPDDFAIRQDKPNDPAKVDVNPKTGTFE